MFERLLSAFSLDIFHQIIWKCLLRCLWNCLECWGDILRMARWRTNINVNVACHLCIFSFDGLNLFHIFIQSVFICMKSAETTQSPDVAIIYFTVNNNDTFLSSFTIPLSTILLDWSSISFYRAIGSLRNTRFVTPEHVIFPVCC